MENKNTPNMEELDLDQLTNVSGGGYTIPLINPKAVHCPYNCGWTGLPEELPAHEETCVNNPLNKSSNVSWEPIDLT